MQDNDYTRVDYWKAFRTAYGIETKHLEDRVRNEQCYSQASLLFIRGSLALQKKEYEEAKRLCERALDKFEQYPGLGDTSCQSVLTQPGADCQTSAKL